MKFLENEPPLSADHDDIERGCAAIRQMDPSFEPAIFVERACLDFTNIQLAQAACDTTILRDLLEPGQFADIQKQCENLKRVGRTKYVQRVEVKPFELCCAWGNTDGRDIVAMTFFGLILEYTLDDRTGAVVTGSKTEPRGFSEFWVFIRPHGPNQWKVLGTLAAKHPD